VSLAGRKLADFACFGHDAFSTFAIAGKLGAQQRLWAFMLGLVMVFVDVDVHQTLPGTALDINWILKGGTRQGPPARQEVSKRRGSKADLLGPWIHSGHLISVSGISLAVPVRS